MTGAIFIRTAAGGYRHATPSEICERASAYVFERVRRERPVLSTPSAAGDYLKHQAGLDHEQFGVCWLDKTHRLLACEILFTGTIDGAQVYPREIAKAALKSNAACVILFHNHPSGNTQPSAADEHITRQLREVLSLIDVSLIDHLVIAGTTVVSFCEKGLL